MIPSGTFHVWNDPTCLQETEAGRLLMPHLRKRAMAFIAVVLLLFLFLLLLTTLQVNSDQIFWQRNADGTYSKISIRRRLLVATSAPRLWAQMSVMISHTCTNMLKALKRSASPWKQPVAYGSKPDTYESSTAKDVTMKVVKEGEGPKQLIVKFINHSSENRNVSLNSQLAVIYYTGVHKATFQKEKRDLDLPPNKETKVKLALTYDKYKDQGALMLTLLGRVKETQQVLATQFGFLLRTPDLIIKPIGKPVVGQKMAVEISFINPLPEKLKDVVLNVEGIGLLPVQKITYEEMRSYKTHHLFQLCRIHFCPEETLDTAIILFLIYIFLLFIMYAVFVSFSMDHI